MEHGFRHWYPEYGKNAFSQDVCEHALAHGLLGKLDAAYRRGDLLDKRVVFAPALAMRRLIRTDLPTSAWACGRPAALWCWWAQYQP